MSLLLVYRLFFFFILKNKCFAFVFLIVLHFMCCYYFFVCFSFSLEFLFANLIKNVYVIKNCTIALVKLNLVSSPFDVYTIEQFKCMFESFCTFKLFVMIYSYLYNILKFKFSKFLGI